MGDRCDACGREVSVAGGISGFWNLDHDETGGLTLEFEDGSEHFLCFACVEELPDYPTAEDVDALGESEDDGGDGESRGDGGDGELQDDRGE